MVRKLFFGIIGISRQPNQIFEMKVFLCLCVLLLFVISCNQKSSDFELIPEIKSVIIPITSDQLNSYQVFSNYSEGDTNKLIAYNGFRHALDYFDLDNAEVLKSESLNMEGPNGVGVIESMYWHSPDSVFLFEKGKLHILKEGGQKTDTIDLYGLFGGKQLGEPICNFYFKLKYRKKEKAVYFSLIHQSLSPKERAAVPLVASVNIEDRSVEVLPIHHTAHYGDVEGKVGFIAYLGFQDFMGDRMIYNFQYESTLFSFDVAGKEGVGSSSHEMKFVPMLADMEDPGAFDLHAIENPHFLTPIPDNWRNLIYRGIWDSPDSSLPESGFTEKAMSIGVFDSDLSLISRFSLPNYTYQINNWFVNENGLYLNYAHPRNGKASEDRLVFHVFRFEKKDN